MEKKDSILDKIKEYGSTEAYPFHMPGHKRQAELGITSFPNPFSVDITEIDGFDNLHHPVGILKASMEWAAAIYGTNRTYYLVNGSTGGILSALCGTVKFGGRVVMARNSHKAAYHAVMLSRLEPVYVYPDCMEAYGIQGGIAPEAVEDILRTGKDVQAVFITSPTYEGIVSDVEAIAEIAHKYKLPLIVDEAHGAHFSFSSGIDSAAEGYFPKSALECGADVVIQSLHKTLPSLTQTAVLHIKSKLVAPEDIEKYLGIFQSSSPSYVLMASVENCIAYMDGMGRRKLSDYASRLKKWMRECGKELHLLKLLTDDVIGTGHAADRDISKILVSTRDVPITGVELSGILREQYHLESEMSCYSYVLLMTSLMDREEGFERLQNALIEVDKRLIRRASAGLVMGTCPAEKPVRRISIAEAMDITPVRMNYAEAAGRISCDFITVYPPGIPAVVPGELITDEIVRLIEYYTEAGFTVEGVMENEGVLVAGV